MAEVGPDQAVAQSLLPVAEAEVRTARMFPNPSLGLSGGRSEPVAAATLTLHLPILGQRGAHVRAAEKALEQTRLEALSSLWKLRHDARIAYYTQARAAEELAIALEVEQLTRRVAEIAATRYDAGAGSMLEKLQARLELARLAALPLEAVAQLADPLARVGDTPPPETLLAEAEKAHPELRALEAERFAALARVQSARADRRPLFSLDLGAELLDPSTCGGSGYCVGPRGGLGFDLPLFNLNGGPIARAQAEARAAELKRAAAARRIETAVRAAWALYAAAVTRARFFETRYVPSATQVESMAREGFAAGKTGLLPLIEAQRALLDSRLGQTEARFAVQAARADLEGASGVALSAP